MPFGPRGPLSRERLSQKLDLVIYSLNEVKATGTQLCELAAITRELEALQLEIAPEEL